MIASLRRWSTAAFWRGAAGAAMVLALVGLVWVVWHLWQDHIMLHQGMTVLSNLITAHPELLRPPK